VTLILVNAAYLNAPWQDPFERHFTREDEFTLPDGTRKKIMLMHQEGHWPHATGEGFQVVALPYRDGLTCYGFLPDHDSSLDRMLSGLTRTRLDQTLQRMAATTVSLALPRFRVEWGNQLNDALSALGMAAAFGGEADFAALTPDHRLIWIDSVLHRTYLQVDEEGTEAAAATEILMMEGSLKGAPRVIEMRFDRPFLLMIRHDATQVILFLAAVTDPQAV
jgi:serpin B